MSGERCGECGCAMTMRFADGCHTAAGFICRCPVTPPDNDGNDAA